jgi:outer membrane protein OmpA-like peptidoglycan-associated protein
VLVRRLATERGFAGSRGSSGVNRRLSLPRADAVTRGLAQRSIHRPH